MSIKSATPYLFFNGNAEKALQFYERTLGARTEGLMRYGEMPGGTGTCPPEDKQRVMHSVMLLGEAKVMVSDVPSSMPGPAGNNVNVVLEYDDLEAMTRSFEALAATGNVKMGLHDAFWGAKFGMLEDELGIDWMFVCPTKK